MSIVKEFREFALKGNVVDLAVGVIIAWAIFIAVKLINRLKREEEKPAQMPPAAPPRQEALLEEIRDLLKKS